MTGETGRERDYLVEGGRKKGTGLDFFKSVSHSKFQCKFWRKEKGLRGERWARGNMTPTSGAAERGVAQRSSTGRRAGWVSGEEGSRGTPSGSCGACPLPTQSSGWNPPGWRRPPAGTVSSRWSQATSPAEERRGGMLHTHADTTRGQQLQVN